MAGEYASLLDDLQAEQEQLASDVDGIGRDDWLRPTPARGWDVRDSIAHLADTDEVACDTCTDGPRALNVVRHRYASSEDFTLAGVLRGRRRPGRDVLEWWRESSAREREVLDTIEPATRIPWGLGMSASAFATARLMETWAHGLDVRTALGRPARDTNRLRHVAWISLRALPYAFTVAGRPVPEAPIRAEVTLPDGSAWTFGPPDAPARITGPAAQLCRLFVQRIRRADSTELRAEGDAADAALDVARAFL
ncbi:MAG: maleylpyruvate isomerase family mycothiol-dependent enzyme [Actinobacteria bacterium]|nr:maleylpyruvate isomerase family mycothiol-dependent enzyme [Actinomycetota bacterium]